LGSFGNHADTVVNALRTGRLAEVGVASSPSEHAPWIHVTKLVLASVAATSAPGRQAAIAQREEQVVVLRLSHDSFTATARIVGLSQQNHFPNANDFDVFYICGPRNRLDSLFKAY
jgi:hypothetical protein